MRLKNTMPRTSSQSSVTQFCGISTRSMERFFVVTNSKSQICCNVTIITAFLTVPPLSSQLMRKKTRGHTRVKHHQSACYTFPAHAWMMFVPRCEKTLCNRKDTKLSVSAEGVTSTGEMRKCTFCITHRSFAAFVTPPPFQ